MNDKKETSPGSAKLIFVDPKNDVAFRKIFGQDERGRIEYAMEEGMKVREVEIAGELKKNGVNIDIIVASTGLTKEEIENL